MKKTIITCLLIGTGTGCHTQKTAQETAPMASTSVVQTQAVAVPVAQEAVAQAPKTSIFDEWSALKTFHGIMSQTFHPAEEGNLAPIKTRSAEMVEKATQLANSEIPADFKTEKISTAVTKLKEGSQSLHALIQRATATDAEITFSLTALHDVFHEIVGLCREKHD